MGDGIQIVPPTEPFLTMRDAVMEIRDDVKNLAVKIDRIDRDGSIGTKQELVDHEDRLRRLESAGFRLSGVWATLGVGLSLLVGLTGVALGAGLFS